MSIPQYPAGHPLAIVDVAHVVRQLFHAGSDQSENAAWIASGCNPPDEWRLKYCVLLARFVTETKISPTNATKAVNNNEEMPAGNEEADVALAQRTAQQTEQATKNEPPKNHENATTGQRSDNTLDSTEDAFSDHRSYLKRPRGEITDDDIYSQAKGCFDYTQIAKLEIMEFLREKIPSKRPWSQMKAKDVKALVDERCKFYISELKRVFGPDYEDRAWEFVTLIDWDIEGDLRFRG
ncbi:hypothetical protein MBLNU457_g0388t3 [Dothideomycetes sp. NU457]